MSNIIIDLVLILKSCDDFFESEAQAIAGSCINASSYQSDLFQEIKLDLYLVTLW